MSNPVLRGIDIHKSFRDGKNKVEVLKGVNLEIEQAEMTAIIGSSGSGKSTLLHVLGGLDSPDTGQVFIKDKDIHKVSTRNQGKIRNQQLGFVYQFHHLLAEFTALENVAMPLIIGGENQNAAYDAAEQVIKKVGLGERLTHKPSELSGGERQRIAIGRALVTKPACILADEPTGNLDTMTAQAVNELMFELNESEKTSFLIVSHDLKLADSMQKTYQMKDGELELIKH
ncbi:lipoprotein-releasing ABC transporter ATP-binding protein LolD [Aliikangiella coralliicola]|uniref:Lipoprotein-releasing system ATP-binding protein LolD n=1 Tax=Aliikangiella coralliicola TaxID=2592383 RepID=A0A545U4N1_9GAMM|nr:lipoprotein-releasing ABC transporter ATP-binding protein LolD [Aliikangiella coralliicola]TQV84429.1 lipoprotein-releasing ABC transporter ATP-binding protein LolD [Aliikangiella coralliicola]